MAKPIIHIALVGNPNSGKTSLFNALTGMNQRVGNFPGVTVDKKTGQTTISDGLSGNIIDLPGTYSLYPKRLDEWVSYRVLLNQDKDVRADLFVVVIDASNLKRNLLFCSQILDLKKPVVVALSMVDLAKKKGIQIDLSELERELGVPVVSVNPRKGKGISQLKKAIELTASNQYKIPVRDFIENKELALAPIEELQQVVPGTSNYTAIHFLINHEEFELDNSLQNTIESIEDLEIEWLKNKRYAAVSSGASTPTYLTNQVIDYLKQFDINDSKTYQKPIIDKNKILNQKDA